jgi:hypothetical protein
MGVVAERESDRAPGETGTVRSRSRQGWSSDLRSPRQPGPAIRLDRRRRGRLALVLLVWAIAAGRWMPRGPLTTTHADVVDRRQRDVAACRRSASRLGRWSMVADTRVRSPWCSSWSGSAPTARRSTASTSAPTACSRSSSAAGSTPSSRCCRCCGVRRSAPGAARHLDPARTSDASAVVTSASLRAGRRAVAVVAGIGLVAVSVALLRPASTDAIVDAEGREIAGQHRRAHHRRDQRPRAVDDDPRTQRRQPGAALPGRRARWLRARCDAQPPRRARAPRHRGDLGPARHREVVRRARPGVDAHRRQRRRRHARRHRLLARAVRPGPDLPRRPVVGHGPRGARRPAGAREVRRVRRHRADGQPVATDRIFYDDTLAWARANGDTGWSTTWSPSARRRTRRSSTTRRRCRTSTRSTRTTTAPTRKVRAGSPRTSSSRSIEHLTKRYGDQHRRRRPHVHGAARAGDRLPRPERLREVDDDEGHARPRGRRPRPGDDRRPPLPRPPDPARTVGAMIESDAFHPGRSGRNHLRILADATGIASTGRRDARRGRARRRRRPRAGAYSLGMRQRLGLAAALLGEPPVLILDEPGNGLDPQGIRTLRDLLRAHAAKGGTVFVSSHLLSEVEHLADDVVVINQGRSSRRGRWPSCSRARRSCARRPGGSPALETAGAASSPRPDELVVVRGCRSTRSASARSPAGIPLHELSPAPGRSRSCSSTGRWTADPSRGPTHRRHDQEVRAMTMDRLIRAELRKLTTTKMPWAFLAVLAAIAAINAFAVVAGTDMDGSKAFIATEADQQSLMAFAANAFMGAGLFGAIAVAREYGHHTVVPTFLASPRRHRAVIAQLVAVALGGAVLSLIGAGLTVDRRRAVAAHHRVRLPGVGSSQRRPHRRCGRVRRRRRCGARRRDRRRRAQRRRRRGHRRVRADRRAAARDPARQRHGVVDAAPTRCRASPPTSPSRQRSPGSPPGRSSRRSSVCWRCSDATSCRRCRSQSPSASSRSRTSSSVAHTGGVGRIAAHSS